MGFPLFLPKVENPEVRTEQKVLKDEKRAETSEKWDLSLFYLRLGTVISALFVSFEQK